MTYKTNHIRKRLHHLNDVNYPRNQSREQLTTQYCRDVQFLLSLVEALEENRRQLIDISQHMNKTITILQREKHNLIGELRQFSQKKAWIGDVFGQPTQIIVEDFK
jgi:hypothetical protein